MSNDPMNMDDTLLPGKPPPTQPPPAGEEDGTLALQASTASTGSAPANSPHEDSGAVAGYEILCELGRGGMGVVYKARQIRLKRLVALKMILSGSHAGANERERFRREAETIARLQHPHIIQIYEIGERGGLPYFSMELIEGTTLQAKLNGTPQPSRLAAHLIETLARTVHFAHQHGIVHRDLKPGNILLAPGGSVSQVLDADGLQMLRTYGVPKIMDFGLAKSLDNETMQTRTGDLLGTPSYMAPEQAAGKLGAIGPAADIYALGSILYEMLTGRPPFRTATPMDTLWQVIHEDALPPSRLHPRLPKDLERICLKCLEKDPQKRYASGLELAEDLRRHLNGEPVHARPATPWQQMWLWCRRNPVPTSLLIAVTLTAAFGFWHLTRLTTTLSEFSALESAKQQAEIMDEVNHYYADVIHRLREKNDQALVDQLPAPATLTIELGTQISLRSKHGVHVRLYSEHPFKKRKATGEGGPRDEFEREALAALQRDPSEAYYRFEKYQGRMSLRYATARIMKLECLACHNTHPDNVKHDWKTGDVRGVLEIIRPLHRDVEHIEDGLRGTFVLVGLLLVASLLVSALVLLLTNRRRVKMDI